MKKMTIADYCKNYGADLLYAYYEGWAPEWNAKINLPIIETPDDFYEEFGEDAEWDYDAYKAGMEEALKDMSGYDYIVTVGGYNTIAYYEGTRVR